MQKAQPAWTTRRLLAWMSEAFSSQGLESPRLMAELLVAHVIGCERLRLYMDPDRPASPLERETLRTLVARALKHEPVQYLVGEAWFFSLPFHVDRRVLIPRPATETIVEHILQHARVEPGFGGVGPVNGSGRPVPLGDGVLIADIATGSGCIAVALLRNMPRARAIATDASPDALELAARNARRHNVSERVELLQGDLLGALDQHPVARAHGGLHYLVSNPPYISDSEWPGVPPNVRLHEPEAALRAGADGLRFITPVLQQGPVYLRAGGLILVEVADSHAPAALEIARSNPALENPSILQDFEGLPRVICARRGRP